MQDNTNAEAAFRQYIERVRAANPIEEVVGADAALEPSGSYLMCSSPLRRDRTPSFAVYADDGRWYDFGTSEGGDVFKYVELRDGVDFRGALDTLAQRAGLPTWDERKTENGHDAAAAREVLAAHIERRWIAELIDDAAEYYHRQLPNRVREMVRARYGFDDETIDAFKIGWADGALAVYMHEQLGHDPKRLTKTGLFVPIAGKLVDFFLRRIMFPYLEGGVARYMIGRRVEGHTDDSDFERGKYKKQLTHNRRRDYVSPHVNHILYGLDSLRCRRDVLVITEGVTDAISAIASGFACVSPVTTTFREADHARLIDVSQRYEKVVIFNDFEPNGAGTRGALKTATALFRAGIDARIVDLRNLAAS